MLQSDSHVRLHMHYICVHVFKTKCKRMHSGQSACLLSRAHCAISATFLLNILPTLTVQINHMQYQAKAQDLCAHTVPFNRRAATSLLTLYMRKGPPKL